MKHLRLRKHGGTDLTIDFLSLERFAKHADQMKSGSLSAVGPAGREFGPLPKVVKERHDLIDYGVEDGLPRFHGRFIRIAQHAVGVVAVKSMEGGNSTAAVVLAVEPWSLHYR